MNSEGALPKHVEQFDALIAKKVDAIIIAMGKPIEADAQFKAEADKIGLIVNAPRTGEQLAAVITQAYATPARVIERLRKLNNP